MANPIIIRKIPTKWRKCIDFIDLSKACPKDYFLVPSITQLVDTTARHELLSFMDAYFGYNQIRMAKIDEEKTSFVTDWDIYCYMVMSFGLRNSSAIYQ